MKTRSIAIAALLGTFGLASFNACAQDVGLKTVAALYENKATLAGKKISAQGKVVKVNNDIMGRNFVHLQDGTGSDKTNDLLVTSKQTAKVGDQVVISGTLVLDRDFGSGYAYGMLIEDATIMPKK